MSLIRISILALISILTVSAFGQAGTATSVRYGSSLPAHCQNQIFLKSADVPYWCGSVSDTWNHFGPLSISAGTHQFLTAYSASTGAFSQAQPAEADIANLVSDLAAKAALSHTHTESDITNLISDLAGKASSSHTHPQSDITGLVAALAGKASTSHTHAESDVTNLVSDLAATEKSANKDQNSGYPGLTSGGLLKAAEFPAPSSSTFGGVKSLAASSTKYLTSIGTDGIPVAAQPAYTDISGTPPKPLLLTVGSGTNTVGASTTSYFIPFGSYGLGSTEVTREIVLPVSGTIANLTVVISTAQPASGNLVITFRMGPFNGTMVPQSLTVTIPLSSPIGVYSDITHSFAYTAGQAISIQVVNNATGTSAAINSICATFQ